mgnify:CR=1 FL=1
MLKTAQRLFQRDKIKQILDKYAEQYDTEDFIKDDPVQFIHLYKNTEDIELAGFISSMFAYGKREHCIFCYLLPPFIHPIFPNNLIVIHHFFFMQHNLYIFSFKAIFQVI